MTSLRIAVKTLLVVGTLLAANTTLAGDISSDRRQASMQPTATDRRSPTSTQAQQTPHAPGTQACSCRLCAKADAPRA
jgi:hypothetical protein